MQSDTKRANRIDWCLLGLVIIAHTLFCFYVADFRRRIISYPDELVYYDLAKALFSGAPLNVHGAPYTALNLAYPLVLAPFMGIRDTVLRLRMIGLLNSVLLSVTALPVWLIGKELNLRRSYRWIAVIIIMVWPDLVISGMLMTEALYWPLASVAFLFCVKSFRTHKPVYAILAAFACYLCYFCREVALCVGLAYIAFQILSPVSEEIASWKNNTGAKKRAKTILKRFDWLSFTLFTVIFFSGYYLTQKIILGQGNIAIFSGVVTLDSTGSYRKLYFLYDILCYFLCATTAFFILPVLAPITHYKQLKPLTRMAYLYGMILLGGTLITVSYIIGLIEDMGIEQIRIHFRYFAPYIMLLLPVYLSSVDEEHYLDRSIEEKRFNRNWIIVLLFMTVQTLMMQTPMRGAVSEHLSLGYFHLLQDNITPIAAPANASITFDLASIITSCLIGLPLIVGFILARWKRTRRFAIWFFSLAAVCVCAANTYLGFKQLRLHYSVSEPVYTDMAIINRYFAENGLSDCNVLYICNEWYNEDAQNYDLYFDAGNEYITTWQHFKNLLGDANGNEIDLENCNIPEDLRNWPVQTGKIDYLIEIRKESGLDTILSGLTRVEDIPLQYGLYSVFKNEDPGRLQLPEDEEREHLIQIIGFTDGSYYCAPEYVTRGISGCEGSFSWTDGHEMEIVAPVPEEVSHVRVKLNTYMTYMGFQPVNVRQGGELVYEGGIQDDDEIAFDLTAENGELRFVIELPGAISPASVGQSGDQRLLALALWRIKLYDVSGEYSE